MFFLNTAKAETWAEKVKKLFQTKLLLLQTI